MASLRARAGLAVAWRLRRRQRRQQRAGESPDRRPRAGRRAGAGRRRGGRSPPARSLRSSLHEPDFVSANRVPTPSTRSSGRRGHGLDAGPVTVRVPAEYRDVAAELIARLEPLPVDARRGGAGGDQRAHRHGGGGRRVRLGPAAVAHGNLSVRIATRSTSRSRAAVAGRSDGGRAATSNRRRGRATQLVTLEEGTTLDAVVRALNALGATPRDIIAVMQALKAPGASDADDRDSVG